MIEKIIMNDVASYKNKTELVTNKRVNLIYGLNGTGKSTISNYLYDQKNERYKSCSIEGMNSTDKILVYNLKFVADNFYETEDIHGIFTLSKENAKAINNIRKAQEQLKNLNEEQDKDEKEKKKLNDTYSKKIDNIKDKIWEIKGEYSGGDRVLEYCLDGLKAKKDTLFQYVLGLDKENECPKYTIEDLKKEAGFLEKDEKVYEIVPSFGFEVAEYEENVIFQKNIIGNQNSTVAGLINALGNSDWVKTGLNYINEENDDNICPFCQQKTITTELINNIEQYFDKSYQNDLDEIDHIRENYLLKSKEIPDIDIFLNNSIGEKYKDKIKPLVNNLKITIDNNIKQMEEKYKEPSTKIAIKSTLEIIKDIKNVIDEINEEIKLFNEKIANKKTVLKEIKIKFWKLMRWQYDGDIANYQSEDIKFKNAVKVVDGEISKIIEEISNQKKTIAVNQRDTVNIDEAINNINQNLLDIGIDAFTIEKYSDDDALYHLHRTEKEENDVFKSLSEGEKMVISFLYFIELCKGGTNNESVSDNKIIVIDDPISSLSHIHIYNIGRIIHNEFLRTEKYDQIFIFTHSLYFYYELTCMKPEDREAKQNLFRLIKNMNGSGFEKMKYEEIQNDYQAYWHIIKDENQHPALIANCMRNIIEYFFNFVEKKDLNDVFQKKELQQIRFAAFIRYMNRESHSKGQNIFDIKEFDYDDFKEALRLVFKLCGYEEHYKRMVKKC